MKMWKSDEQREIARAMAKDCLRVCADGSCKDPLAETHKAMCDCNRGKYDKYIVNESDLHDAIKTASETFLVDVDVLKDVLRQVRLQNQV